MDQQTRQEYIRAAISFLQNPKLASSSLQDKLEFLKGKGLTKVEIDDALNAALINRQQSQSGIWNFLLILGICAGGYKLYQTYIESYEIKLKDKKKLEEQQQNEKMKKEEEDRKKLQDKEDEPRFSELLSKILELKNLIEVQRKNQTSDIQSLKTLLLSHEKFAAPPVIPAWQLKNSKEEKRRATVHKVDDLTKGSSNAESDTTMNNSSD